MNELRKAAEMALEFVEWLCSDDHSVKPKNNALKTRDALRQALDDKPPVKSYCGGKPNYCTTQVTTEVPCKTHPDAPHGFDRNASHNADRYVCECEGWEPVDAVNMTQDRVDETAKGEHEPVAWRNVIPGGRMTDKWDSGRVADYNQGWNDYRKAAKTALEKLDTTPQPPAQSLTPEWYAQWIRNNYQDHPNIATLCDEMTKAAHGITKGNT